MPGAQSTQKADPIRHGPKFPGVEYPTASYSVRYRAHALLKAACHGPFTRSELGNGGKGDGMAGSSDAMSSPPQRLMDDLAFAEARVAELNQTADSNDLFKTALLEFWQGHVARLLITSPSFSPTAQ